MDPTSIEFPSTSPSPTMAAALRARAAECGERVFLRFEDDRWTFAETYREACRYANLFVQLRDSGRPFHVGVLMDNMPAFVFAEFVCALAGATLAGLNPTRTGAALAPEIAS